MKAATSIISILVLANVVALGQTPNPGDYAGAAWSPYLAGSLIGVLAWLTFYFSRKPVGASSAFATTAGLIGKAVAPRHTRNLKYFKDNPPKADWELLFVAAAVFGAFVAAWHGGELTQSWQRPMWVERFGESTLWLRAIAGLAGGALMALGARMADGCTSGHGISGTLQLNVASWIALICFFVGGVIVANLMFRL
jgi:uncharacterized protein